MDNNPPKAKTTLDNNDRKKHLVKYNSVIQAEVPEISIWYFTAYVTEVPPSTHTYTRFHFLNYFLIIKAGSLELATPL